MTHTSVTFPCSIVVALLLPILGTGVTVTVTAGVSGVVSMPKEAR